jgi:hypothetical protein
MAKPIPKMSFSEIGEGLKNIDMSLSLGKTLAFAVYILKMKKGQAKHLQ